MVQELRELSFGNRELRELIPYDISKEFTTSPINSLDLYTFFRAAPLEVMGYDIFSSTNHSISDLNSKNERGEACGHFPLSESKNKNQTADKSLIVFRFGVEEEHILRHFPL